MTHGFRILISSLAACSGCTIDVGPSEAASRCEPAAPYFVTDVWPRYLQDGKCGRAECHSSADTGRGYFRLSEPPLPPPARRDSIAQWPAAWRENYRAAIQQVRCDEPLKSRLLLLPTYRSESHPGGSIVTNLRAADQLFGDWVTAPR